MLYVVGFKQFKLGALVVSYRKMKKVDSIKPAYFFESFETSLFAKPFEILHD